MTTHAQRAEALADKITARAEEALDGIDWEMTIMNWPAEFRAIMWEAVAATATQRAVEARLAVRKTADR